MTAALVPGVEGPPKFLPQRIVMGMPDRGFGDVGYRMALAKQLRRGDRILVRQHPRKAADFVERGIGPGGEGVGTEEAGAAMAPDILPAPDMADRRIADGAPESLD